MSKAATLANIPSYSFMRNRIINGNFEIWQRGTTSRTQGAAGVYSADRWTRMGFQDAAYERVSVTSAPAGLQSRFAIRASSSTTGEAAGGTRIDLSQKIESVNCYDLSSQPITVSFWVRFSAATISSSTGTPYSNWSMYLQYNTSTTDSAASTDTGNSVAALTVITNGSLPTAWTRYTATTTVPAGTNNISVRFQFAGLGSTASAGTAWYDITEVQLEAGSVATPFERRQFGQEQLLCQRYYQTNPSLFSAMNASNNRFVTQSFGAFMRTTSPNYSIINATNAIHYPGISFYNISSIDSADRSYLVLVPSTNFGANVPGQLIPGTMAAAAEL